MWIITVRAPCTVVLLGWPLRWAKHNCKRLFLLVVSCSAVSQWLGDLCCFLLPQGPGQLVHWCLTFKSTFRVLGWALGTTCIKHASTIGETFHVMSLLVFEWLPFSIFKNAKIWPWFLKLHVVRTWSPKLRGITRWTNPGYPSSLGSRIHTFYDLKCQQLQQYYDEESWEDVLMWCDVDVGELKVQFRCVHVFDDVFF